MKTLMIMMMVLLSLASAQDKDAFRDAFLSGDLSWDEVLSEAQREGEVSWFHWGGSEELNLWIEEVVKPDLAELGVTLNTSRVPDTRDAVDQVIADNAVGRGLGEGVVDAIWINGENFFTLATQDLLFGPFADKLPNSQYFYLDAEDERSAINLRDNGFPTDLQEVPWAQFQYTCVVDGERLTAADAPADFEELESFLRANPGRFTYVRPPDYIGNTFVQSALYAFSETGPEAFQVSIDELDPAEFAAAISPGIEYLQRIEPFLLGGSGVDGDASGVIYPETEAANEAFLINGEVDMQCQFGIYSAEVGVADGTYPATVQNVIFPASGMITNKSFITVPANAPNPAAALVLADYLSSPANQASKLNALGYAPGVDVPLLDEADQAALEAASPDLAGVTFEALSAAQVPEANASIVDIIEAVWLEVIGQGSDRPIEEIVAEALE